MHADIKSIKMRGDLDGCHLFVGSRNQYIQVEVDHHDSVKRKCPPLTPTSVTTQKLRNSTRGANSCERLQYT